MRAVLLAALLFALPAGAGNAKKDAKSVASAIKTVDARDDLGALASQIETALEDPGVAEDPAAWITKGDVYAAIATAANPPPADDPVATAIAAYRRATTLDEKGKSGKAVASRLFLLQTTLKTAGVVLLENDSPARAAVLFEGVLAAHDALTELGGTSILQVEVARLEHLWFTARAHADTGNRDRAIELLETVIGGSYDQPDAYALRYELDPGTGMSALELGRARYPNHTPLIIADVDHRLRMREYAGLQGLLDRAIEAEPNNPMLYYVQGQVHESQSMAAFGEGDAETGERLYVSAEEAYQAALVRNPTYPDALESLGILHFNRGIEMLEHVRALENDPASVEAHDLLLSEMLVFFARAKEVLIRAERIEPNDPLILDALVQIHAQLMDTSTASALKKRRDALAMGETFETPFFAETP